LGELGYNVQCFCFQDSPRRAHSIAAQGGINAAKNYQNDGDSVFRLFYDTIKGGDFRSREANVYRLAEISLNIIDQCVAQWARRFRLISPSALPNLVKESLRFDYVNFPAKLQMNFKLKVWRQKAARSPGSFKDYDAKDIPSEASFLEMLDILNETLVSVDEGICETCSLVINGVSHGPGKGTTCQVYMRRFVDGDTIWIEPFRAAGFPFVKDLVVDRSAFDQIIETGGYIVVRTGSAPEANSLPVPKHDADLAMEPAPVSDAAPAWRLAQTPPRCCSCRPKSRTSLFCRKARRNATVELSGWFGGWMNSVSGTVETITNVKQFAPLK
jgi:hypothetical protein